MTGICKFVLLFVNHDFTPFFFDTDVIKIASNIYNEVDIVKYANKTII